MPLEYSQKGPPSTAMTVRWKKKYNRRQQHGTHDTRQALEQKMQYLEATYDYTNEIEGIPTELFDQIVKSNI